MTPGLDMVAGLSSSYTINLNSGVNVHSAGNVDLGGGRLYVNDTISGMDGGSLNASYQYVGSTGTGTFTQTAGTNSITSNLYVGYNTGSNGTYNLSGTGQLSAVSENVGYYSGTGTFIQTGGTNFRAKPLCGLQRSSNGTYNQCGGTNSVTTLHVGDGGTGAVAHTI